MLKAIIIDDEQQARVALKQELEFNCPQIEIIAEADSVKKGIATILEYRPDLIFLDIQLTDGIGFDILETIKNIDFKIIFTTAYSDYALKAIKFSALDYLLKPIDGQELKIAVEKLTKRTQENFNQQINNFLNNHQSSNQQKRIALTTAEGIHLYELQQIVRCTSEGNYTRIFFNNGKKLLVAKTLKDLEELLCQYNFERIHKSHIININHLVSYLNKDNGFVVMSDQSTIAVAQRKKSHLLSVLNALNN